MLEIINIAKKLPNLEVQGIYTMTLSTLEMVVLVPSAANYMPLHEAIQNLGLLPFVRQEGQLDDGNYGIRLLIDVTPGWNPLLSTTDTYYNGTR
jgi:hypothetical protein